MGNKDIIKKPSHTPPVYFFIGVAIILVCKFLLPAVGIPFLYPMTAPYCGGVLIALGFILMLWVSHIMRLANTPHDFQKPKKMLTKGPFKFSRNPMYVGFVLMMFGGAIASNSAFALAAPIMMFAVLDRLFIPFEQSQMQKRFGNEYKKYKAKVRRWI
ncbi:MAG: isoprenylcysteine carboxylmethyltransferase family protein [Alphaproteobacteria bacterium]|nr:isoprenylcysteine carboxylmethyltransferase family protein [Alphaproteobacteria bacterium]